MSVELEKIFKQQGCVFLIVDAFGEMKNQRSKKSLGGQKSYGALKMLFYTKIAAEKSN